MNSTFKLVLFKAESDNERDEYLELFERNQFEANCVSPIRFEFRNLDVLASKLEEEQQFRSNYSSLVITSPRVIQIVKQLIQDKRLTLNALRSIPCITVGPQTQKKLIDELEIRSLINNEQLNINNAKELANYLIENQDEICKQIDLSKPLLYPTSDLSKEELKAHLNHTSFKVEKLICYQTLPNANLDRELKSILENSIDSEQPKETIRNEIEKSFLFVFFSPSGVKSVKEMVNCVEIERMKSIAIGPTTKKSIEDHRLNLVSTSLKPTPEALLEAVLNYIKTTRTI